MRYTTLLTILFFLTIGLLTVTAQDALAERSDFDIPVQVEEDPWATNAEAESETPVPIRRPRPQAQRESTTENPLEDPKTDYIASILTIQDYATRSDNRGQMLAYVGLGLAIAALIGIIIAIYYVHRRRQAQARAHAKQYSKKLRRALKTSLKNQRAHPELPIAQTFTAPHLTINQDSEGSSAASTATPANSSTTSKRLDPAEANA